MDKGIGMKDLSYENLPSEVTHFSSMRNLSFVIY